MVRINILSVRQVKESGHLYDVDKRVRGPEDVARIVEAVLHLSVAAEERFGIFSLNIKNEVIGVHVLSMGSLNASIVHPREVFKAAILNNAGAIVAFHNHPSGNTTPSPEDIELTQRLADCGSLLGIELLDHIIVGGNRHTSIKETGLIKGF